MTASLPSAVFLRTGPDGRGVISLLEVPGIADKPGVFEVAPGGEKRITMSVTLMG